MLGGSAKKMFAIGADSFWYWDVGAFAFSGDETAISVSGRDHVTSDRIIASDDIITIDLSPQNYNTQSLLIRPEGDIALSRPCI